MRTFIIVAETKTAMTRLNLDACMQYCTLYKLVYNSVFTWGIDGEFGKLEILASSPRSMLLFAAIVLAGYFSSSSSKI